MEMRATPLLVGRDEELARIEEFLAAAADRPAALLLEGEQGIGKTTLVHACLGHAREAAGQRVADIAYGYLDPRVRIE
jgi:Cdc6-like AAA superfamily ATPase